MTEIKRERKSKKGGLLWNYTFREKIRKNRTVLGEFRIAEYIKYREKQERYIDRERERESKERMNEKE